ncbi:hypothetical protein DL762_004076 [Monosporascus cannonballus]|uniref:Saccharopine dehydrogenase-like C-terminal domain-containing protein n=1 Tax=Monosporascus cannonballus TaxID=155416 RepID=A0ABY0H8T9_9PEZI|nr:hypothetical protein DL762_004076 [Monosporascus cannonballus]RYO90221.1 hypothetical protein DL763_005394 [Monosporascus cannonballus]
MPRLLTVTHPWSWVVHVIRSAIKGKTQVVTTSYVSPAIKELNGAAKEAGITVLNEVGVDPGVDHLYAIKVIREVHEKGGKVIDGYSFLAYPNRNSVPFREFYQIPEAQTIIRGSLRYDGNPQLVKALIDIGWLDVEAKDWLSPGITWAQIQQRTTSASSSSERDLLVRVDECCSFRSSEERNSVIAGLRWIGLFSDAPAPVQGNLLDTVSAHLDKVCKFRPG